MPIMIIGLTGTLSAGKGTIAEFLENKGFRHFSVRQFLIEEIKKRNLPINRDSMVWVANELRKTNSSSYIVEQLYEQAIKENKDCVIESIRTQGEIEALKKKEKFYLLAVDAEPKKRYDRAQERKSETDNQTFEEFLEDERREMNSTNPNEQNLSVCIQMADYKLENNGSVAELLIKVENILEEIKGKTRPSWDEYFMGIMHAVAKRATCDRGKSGCVIAKNKQILVTGYVGSPKGLPHCDEVGHQMKTTIHEDGTQTQHCVRTTHAEQNAICQAAKIGVSIDGATLYCKMTPCTVCAKMIINAGIKRVVCEKKYHAGKESEEMFKQAGIEIEFLNEEVEQYKNQ